MRMRWWLKSSRLKKDRPLPIPPKIPRPAPPPPPDNMTVRTGRTDA